MCISKEVSEMEKNVLNDKELNQVVGGTDMPGESNRGFLKEEDGRLDPNANPTRKEECLQNMNAALQKNTDTVKVLGDLLKKISSNIR